MESSFNTNERNDIYVEEKKQSEEKNLNNAEKEKEKKSKKEDKEENIEIEENKEIEDEKAEIILEEMKKEKKNKESEVIKDLEENNIQIIDKKEENINNNDNNNKPENENSDIEEENMIDKNNKNDEINELSSNEIQYSNSLLEIVQKYNIEKLPDNYDREDVCYKVLFLGDSGVGKSSLIKSCIKKGFDSFYNPTVGFDLLNYVVKINERIIKIQLWDTCGQEEFSMCNQSLFKNASLAIMVYSISNKKTYDNIKNWVSRVKELSKENVIIFLVGNKNDLCSQREVDFLEAKKFGNNEFQLFVETSSKFGYNVDILFKEIVINLYENFLKNESTEEKEETNSEQFFSDEQTSSFLNSLSVHQHRSKKCIKCC